MVGRTIPPRCSWLLSISASSVLPCPSLQCTHTGHSPHHTLTYETRVVLGHMFVIMCNTDIENQEN